MIVYLPNKTQFRDDDPKERGQLARRSLRRRLGLAHSYKVNSSAPSALLGDLPARYSPQDGGGCAFDPARRQSPFRGTSSRHAGLLSMSFHSIAVQSSFLSHNRRISNGWAGSRNLKFSPASPKAADPKGPHLEGENVEMRRLTPFTPTQPCSTTNRPPALIFCCNTELFLQNPSMPSVKST